MVVDRPWKRLHLLLISLVLLISYQQPIAVQHSKSTRGSTMPITTQMVNLAITPIHDEATTTRNIWMTLEAWKTIIYQYYDLDDELGFTMNTLTRAVFGRFRLAPATASNRLLAAFSGDGIHCSVFAAHGSFRTESNPYRGRLLFLILPSMEYSSYIVIISILWWSI